MTKFTQDESKKSFCKRMGLDPKHIRKLDRNTFELVSDEGELRAIIYHSTYILTWEHNGDVLIDNGWFRTATTKDRLNTYMPHNYSIFQKKGEWWITRLLNGVWTKPIHFTRCGLIKADGSYERVVVDGDVSSFDTWKGKW